jgi:hypothetical protein
VPLPLHRKLAALTFSRSGGAVAADRRPLPNDCRRARLGEFSARRSPNLRRARFRLWIAMTRPLAPIAAISLHGDR